MKYTPFVAAVGALMLILFPYTGAENTGNRTIVVQDIYFPGDTIIIMANFLPEEAYIVDPIGKIHDIKFDKNFTAKYNLKRNVILGHYRIFADNVTAEFVVDNWSIEAEYLKGKVVGNVSYYYIKPEFLEYEVGNVSGKVPVKNGSFEFSLEPGEYEITLKCGNAIKKLSTSSNLEILVDRIVTHNGTVRVDGRIVLNGKPAEANLTYWFDDGELKSINVKGIFNLTFTSEIVHLEAHVGNLTARKTLEIPMKRIVMVEDRYFVNDNVTVVTNFKPKKAVIIDPAGKKHKLKFNRENGTYEAIFGLKKDVILGEYTVIVDGTVKKFVVDFCSISAYFNGTITGTVKCHFVHPGFVNYSISGDGYFESGNAQVRDGNFSIHAELPAGNYSAVIEYGNAREVVNFTINLNLRNLYFLGDTIEINLPFNATKAFVETPNNESIKLNFSEKNGSYYAFFTPQSVGIYKVVVDNLRKIFTVDNYSINATFRNSTIAGYVKWNYVEPSKVECTILKLNISTRVEVVDGRFELPLNSLDIPPGSYDVLLKAGNAETILEIVIGINTTIPKTAFVGEPIRITTNFIPKIAYVRCENESINLTISKSGIFEFSINRTGVCEIILDNLSKQIIVDDYIITAEFKNGSLTGRVEYHLIPPEFVEYRILPINVSGRVEVINGSFSLQVNLNTGNYTAILKCGNAVEVITISRNLRIDVHELEVGNTTLKLRGNILLDNKPVKANFSYWFEGGEIETITVNGSFNLTLKNTSGTLHLRAESEGMIVEKTLRVSASKKMVQVGKVYFINDTVIIKTNFKPRKGFLIDPEGYKHKLKFKKDHHIYLSRFNLKKEVVLGNYTVVIDEFVRKFTVDFCTAYVSFEGTEIGTL